MEFRRIGHGSIDSTNERAFAEIAAGRARHGDVHVASAQTAGRGRRGRAWVSAPGQGLYLSVILMPPRLVAPPAITVAAGLALADTTRGLGLRQAHLKWPNDLMFAGAKLAGILVETRGLRVNAPHYVLGIGLNVLQDEFPAPLLAERRVTSLAQARRGLDLAELDLAGVEQRLLADLGLRLEQIEGAPGQLERDYVRAAGLTQGRLCVETAERQVHGRLKAFGFEEGLVLDTEEGVQRLLLEHIRQVTRIVGE